MLKEDYACADRDVSRCPSGFGPLRIWSPRTKSVSELLASGYGLPRGFGPLVILFEERKNLFLRCFFILPQIPTVSISTSMNGLNYKGRILRGIYFLNKSENERETV